MSLMKRNVHYKDKVTALDVKLAVGIFMVDNGGSHGSKLAHFTVGKSWLHLLVWPRDEYSHQHGQHCYWDYVLYQC